MIAATFENEGHIVSLMGQGQNVVVIEILNDSRIKKVICEDAANKYIDRMIELGYQRTS